MVCRIRCQRQGHQEISLGFTLSAPASDAGKRALSLANHYYEVVFKILSALLGIVDAVGGVTLVYLASVGGDRSTSAIFRYCWRSWGS